MLDIRGNRVKLDDNVFIATTDKRIVRGKVVGIQDEELGVVHILTSNNRKSKVWTKDMLLDTTNVIEYR